MKKLVAIAMAVCMMLVVLSGCSKKTNLPQTTVKTTESGGKKTNPGIIDGFDLNNILVADGGHYAEISKPSDRVSVVDLTATEFTDSKAEKNKKVTLNGTEYDLSYSVSFRYKIGDCVQNKYLINGDEKKAVFFDTDGNLKRIAFGYTRIDVSNTDTAESILEKVKPEISKIFDISDYKKVLMPDNEPDDYGLYRYILYNEKDGYFIDSLIFVVDRQNGTIIGVKKIDLPTIDFEVKINKEKENSLIAAKLKEMFETESVRYVSHEIMFIPTIEVYDGKLYVEYTVAPEFTTGEGYAEVIFIPLDAINDAG